MVPNETGLIGAELRRFPDIPNFGGTDRNQC
jgi:hypothetical protein